MKRFTYYVAVLSVLFLLSCEKETFDESLNAEGSQSIDKTIISIGEAPGILPILQQYQQNSNSKEGDSLTIDNQELDLESILKVTDSYGKETYSITKKKVFEAYENRYFENIHIFEKNGGFDYCTMKYDALDDSKKYDPKTFTGIVDLYDKEGNHIAFMDFVNGQRIHLKWVVSYDCWEILIWGDGSSVINSWC